LTYSDFDFKYGKNNIFHEDLSTFILPSRLLQLEICFRDKQQRK